MAKPELVAVRDSRVPALAMASKFKGYKPETEREVRKVEVAEDEALRQLKEAWKTTTTRYGGPWDFEYGSIVRRIESLHYSASDVERFSLALAEFQAEGKFAYKAGVFLSALINSCKDSEFVIHTAHLAGRINYLGYYNTGNITVKGDAGDYVGEWMQNGTMRIEGDAGSSVGRYTKGGEIHVEGSLKDDFGIVGAGVIRAKIFHKGELAYPKATPWERFVGWVKGVFRGDGHG